MTIVFIIGLAFCMSWMAYNIGHTNGYNKCFNDADDLMKRIYKDDNF